MSEKEGKKEKATPTTTSIIIAHNRKRTTLHFIATYKKEKLPIFDREYTQHTNTRNNETENSLFFSLLLFVISRMLFALCSASFARLLPFGLIDIFFLYFIFFCFCCFERDFSVWVAGVSFFPFLFIVWCLFLCYLLDFWWHRFMNVCVLYVWNWWWLWHGHQITIITVQIDVTMCFWLNGILLRANVWTSTKALARTNTHTLTHTQASTNKPTSQSNNTVFSSNASGIFSFAPTHFSVIVARPSGLILIYIVAVSQCVRVYKYVCMVLFFFIWPAAYWLLTTVTKINLGSEFHVFFNREKKASPVTQ